MEISKFDKDNASSLWDRAEQCRAAADLIADRKLRGEYLKLAADYLKLAAKEERLAKQSETRG